ncbi:DNA translocase FtsK [bacterium]|nr:DNA translocase FtsK [bacterium]
MLSRLWLRERANKIFPNKKKAIVPTLRAYFHELTLLLFSAVMLFFSLALSSFNPADNSPVFNDTARASYTNWCGSLGASFAGVTFFSFGLGGYLVLFLGWYLLLMSILPLWFRRKPMRTIGVMALPIFFCSFLAVLPAGFMGASPGGFVGEVGKSFFGQLFGFYGALLAVGFGLLTSFVMSFDLAPSSIVRPVRFFVVKLFVAVRGIIRVASLVVGRAVMWTFKGVVWFFGLLRRRKERPDFQEVLKEATPEKSESPVSHWNEFDEMLAGAARKKKREKPLEEPGVPRDELGTVLDRGLVDEIEKVKVNHEERSYEWGPRLSVFAFRTKVFSGNPFASSKFAAFLRKPVAAGSAFVPPDPSLFAETHEVRRDIAKFEQECRKRGGQLEEKLRHFGVNGSIVSIMPGPVITLFKYRPEIDTKLSKIIALEDDLAMVLQAHSIRIVAPIPGTDVVGFEISNQHREDVFMSDLIQSDTWKQSVAELPLLLGVNAVGEPVIEDLTKMPHLLVAGSTGAGKSVCLHSFLLSLLSRKHLDELKLVLIDPKRLEFSAYADIPNLLFPVITDVRRAEPVLRWIVGEMERRYDEMADVGVRNLLEYNELADTRGLERFPYILIMVDELADLMMVTGKEVEMQLVRIAQMARAAGIHLLLATQRPSVDVLTGIIKVNFPSRISFRVSSKIDSRTILDYSGAEKLLGRGDMLFMNGNSATLQRVHGAYVSVQQIEKLADYLRGAGEPNYQVIDESSSGRSVGMDEEEDRLYAEVLELLKSMDEISISMLQRRLRIGFNRSARIIERLEQDGYIAPAQGSKPRKVIR